MDNRISDEIRAVLNRYTERLREEFGDRIVGVYLYGSLVNGTFDPESSDVDFLTVIRSRPEKEDIARIRQIHGEMCAFSRFGRMLEGEYVGFGDMDGRMPAGKYPYFAYGKFQGYVALKHFAWFQLIEKGVTYYGVNFRDIAGEIEWNDVKDELVDRLSTYWPFAANWKTLLDKWFALVVLSVCRIYYALENKSTTSKNNGGEYALSRLSKDWHRIILEALRIQKRTPGQSLYRSKLSRWKDVRRFVRHMSDQYSVEF